MKKRLTGLLSALSLLSVSMTSSCFISNGISVSAYVQCALAAGAFSSSSFDSFQLPREIPSINSDIAIVPVKEGLAAIENGWDFKFEITSQIGLFTITGINGEELKEIDSTSKILIPPLYESEREFILENSMIKEDNLIEVNAYRTLIESISSGTYDGQSIQGAVLSEPYLTIAIGDDKAKDLKPISTEVDQVEYGVFFSSQFSNTQRSKDVLKEIKSTLLDLASRGGNQTIKYLKRLDEEICIERFGASASIIQSLFLTKTGDWFENQNRVGIKG